MKFYFSLNVLKLFHPFRLYAFFQNEPRLGIMNFRGKLDRLVFDEQVELARVVCILFWRILLNDLPRLSLIEVLHMVQTTQIYLLDFILGNLLARNL